MVPGLPVGVDGYYKRARNLIDEGQFGSPILLTAFNYGRGDVTGVEFSSTYAQGPLSMYGNLTISRAIGRGSDVRLDVINLLDRNYLLRDGSGLGVGNAQYGLRRAVLAGVSQKF